MVVCKGRNLASSDRFDGSVWDQSSPRLPRRRIRAAPVTGCCSWYWWCWFVSITSCWVDDGSSAVSLPEVPFLIAGIDGQLQGGKIFHLLLWDQMRDAAAKSPESYNSGRRLSVVFPARLGRNGNAPGSPLRAVGLMTALTPWVTFADDDVRWDGGHIAALADAAQGLRWAS